MFGNAPKDVKKGAAVLGCTLVVAGCFIAFTLAYMLHLAGAF